MSVDSKQRRKSDSWKYAFPRRALIHWQNERLQFTLPGDNRIYAKFHFHGTTCNNMGVPFDLEYTVELHADEMGRHRIVECSCEPCTGDTGHQRMCESISQPEQFMTMMRAQPALSGRLIDEVLHWQPEVNPAGCLCQQSNRDHKWRMVLQTIHFALSHNLEE